MEYLVLIAALAVFVIVIFIREAVLAKKRRACFVQSLYENYGKLPPKEYSLERYARISGYSDRHSSGDQIDDITWNDLNMDDLFRRMDYTFSATGEEYLYYMLKNAGQEQAAMDHFEEVTEWFREHADERVRVQVLMSRLGYTGKFSLYDYIDHLDYLGERSNAKHYLCNFLFLPLVALAPFQLAYALLGIAVLSGYQIVSYFKDRNEIEPYIISFAYVMRLMGTCRKLCRIPLPACEAETERMQRNLNALRGVKSGSWWVFSSGQSKLSGNPIDIIMDYIRMVFHVDLIFFHKMLAQLRAHREDVDGLITQAGYLEAAISVGAFRTSLRNGWCAPVFQEKNETGREGDSPAACGSDVFHMEEGYHPLLDSPVKNSLHAARGILLTGSNASGKSTFLKTAALNAIMAQTIHTCTAASYQAPCFRIFSSMALRDDIGSGESYYIVEIKALKRILDAAAKPAARPGEESGAEYRPVLCFVDEVLRGTNTVERIAASTQILRSLAGEGVFCFAATHDIELTELLKEEYDNYHFEEEIQDGDILFSYRLHEGKASTRNAIRLLEIMGYEPEIIEKAGRMAGQFVEEGVWRAQ